MFEKITTFLMLFGVALPWLLALGHLVQSKKKRNYIAFTLFFTIGVWQLILGSFYIGILREFHFFLWIDVAFIYSTGPLLYLYYNNLINKEFHFEKKHLFHFLPSLLVAALLTPYYFMDPVSKIKFRYFHPHGKHAISSLLPHFLIIGSILALMIYAFMIIKGNYSCLFKRKDQPNKKVYFFIAFQLSYVIVIALISVVNKILYGNVPKSISVLITIYCIMVYLLILRNPVLGDGSKYSSSRITGLDVNDIVKKMDQLMKNEEIFSEPNLSLPQFAEKLSINTHQLSEILNRHLKISYYDYVNQYRIEKAKSILLNYSDISVTRIIYDIGYNSSSSFYCAFQKATGLSPKKFRELNSKK